MLKPVFIFSLAFLVGACVATSPSSTVTKVAVKTPPERSSAPENIDKCRAGWSATTRGRYSTALALYNDCIETGNLGEASLARTFRNIGITYRRMAEYETAIVYFNKAMTLKPKDIHHDYTNRGNSWSGLKQYEKALKDYEKALTIRPNDGGTIFNRGIVYERLGDLQAARRDFEKALKLQYYSPELLDRVRVYGIGKTS